MFLSSARNRPNNAMIAKNLLLQNSNGVKFNNSAGVPRRLAPRVSNSNGVNFNFFENRSITDITGFKLQRSKF